ncbi:MAG: CehA/McbA family metallohydrolase [Chloroflexota bacterium]|nr:CehA/McbA family metallohydrolase [Chloroflexota bacterium]MBI5702832.1 CehA/McbA family metallohydrolase [Chloroflexota bacterium]
MHEIVVNLHMHTRYSDGSGTHKDIAEAAMKAELDAVIVTDHNVLVQGVEGYYRSASAPTVKPRRVLLLVGQEIHDQDRLPQKNHLLVFNANRDLSALADDPQTLIHAVAEAGGLSFIAHPWDPEAPAFNETDISWEAWDVQGFTGIELWNGLSELKTLVPTKLHGLFYAFFPQFIGHAPVRETLQKWDELLAEGRRIVAIGGSDAHAMHMHMGPLHRVIFPYEFHFRTVNTHVFIPEPLTGDVPADKKRIYEALAAGHCFVGYDLPASTRGFRFRAKGLEHSAIMGDEIPAKGGVTLHAYAPFKADLTLLKDGVALGVWRNQQTLTYNTAEPGIYRVEAHHWYLGKKRGWIYSNPIYVR